MAMHAPNPMAIDSILNGKSRELPPPCNTSFHNLENPQYNNHARFSDGQLYPRDHYASASTYQHARTLWTPDSSTTLAPIRQDTKHAQRNRTASPSASPTPSYASSVGTAASIQTKSTSPIPGPITVAQPRFPGQAAHTPRRTLAGGRGIVKPPRAPRNRYRVDAMDFLHFTKIDLEMGWAAIKDAYVRQFPDETREGIQGLQCRYYRLMEERKVPQARVQRGKRTSWFTNPTMQTTNMNSPKERVHRRHSALQLRTQFGMRTLYPDRYYPWMHSLAHGKFTAAEAESRLWPKRQTNQAP